MNVITHLELTARQLTPSRAEGLGNDGSYTSKQREALFPSTWHAASHWFGGGSLGAHVVFSARRRASASRDRVWLFLDSDLQIGASSDQ